MSGVAAVVQVAALDCLCTRDLLRHHARPISLQAILAACVLLMSDIASQVGSCDTFRQGLQFLAGQERDIASVKSHSDLGVDDCNMGSADRLRVQLLALGLPESVVNRTVLDYVASTYVKDEPGSPAIPTEALVCVRLCMCVLFHSMFRCLRACIPPLIKTLKHSSCMQPRLYLHAWRRPNLMPLCWRGRATIAQLQNLRLLQMRPLCRAAMAHRRHVYCHLHRARCPDLDGVT